MPNQNLTNDTKSKRKYLPNFAVKNIPEDKPPINISNMLLGLQDAFNENNDLRVENGELQSQLLKFQNENDVLKKDLDATKNQFKKDIVKLQEDIKNNNQNLLDSSKQCLQKQKINLEEISELKAQNQILLSELQKKEQEHKDKIKQLETDLKKALENNVDVITKNKEILQRINKYKGKLKYAVTIINDLNNMLVESTWRPTVCNIHTQTGDDPPGISKNLMVKEQPYEQRYNKLQQEDLILSDIFFKTKSFCDNELLFFQEDTELVDSTTQVI